MKGDMKIHIIIYKELREEAYLCSQSKSRRYSWSWSDGICELSENHDRLYSCQELKKTGR